MRVLTIIMYIVLALLISIGAQAQRVAIKTNLLTWATTTPNMGVEASLNPHFTIDLQGAYNAWKFGNGMKLNLYLAQPELRYWPCQKFEGHFWGLHALYGHYNVGLLPFVPATKEHLYRGELYGGGIAYGYHWALGSRWGLEATAGVGYVQLQYNKYRCTDCAELEGSYRSGRIAPTRLGISLIYCIK